MPTSSVGGVTSSSPPSSGRPTSSGKSAGITAGTTAGSLGPVGSGVTGVPVGSVVEVADGEGGADEGAEGDGDGGDGVAADGVSVGVSIEAGVDVGSSPNIASASTVLR